MPITLGSNITSLNAQRRLSESSHRLTKVFERLSSGMRINQSSDDAAGLAISSSLNASARVFTQAIRNVSDGSSLINIADASLGELTNVATRLKELATQSANGTFSLTQRRTMNKEADALVNEFNRIVQSTEFNKLKLYNDTPLNLAIQAGYGVNGSLSLSLGDKLSRNVGTGTFTYVGSIDIDGPIVGGDDLNGDGLGDLVMVSNTPSPDSAIVLISNGDGTFSTSNSFTISEDVVEGLGGDFNADGRQDLAFINSDNTVSLYIGNGNGTFKFGSTLALPEALEATHQVYSDDLNGDGRSDIFLQVSNGFDVYLSNANGSFGPRINYNLGYDSPFYTLADFNNDNVLDFVSSNDFNALTIGFGNGNGTFGSGRQLAVGANPDVSTADLNRDGNADLFISLPDVGKYEVRLGNGDGTFKTGVSYTSIGLYTSGSRSDINNDGYADYFGSDLASNFTILLGNGDGTFKAELTQSFGISASGVTIGISGPIVEFTGDGVDDAAALDFGGPDVYLYIAGARKSSTVAYLDLLTQQNARESMSCIDGILERISSERGILGALQSRLVTASNNLESSKINYRAAEGRISNADIADESARLTRENILQQTSAAILAQANSQPQLALSLLGGI